MSSSPTTIHRAWVVRLFAPLQTCPFLVLDKDLSICLSFCWQIIFGRARQSNSDAKLMLEQQSKSEQQSKKV